MCGDSETCTALSDAAEDNKETLMRLDVAVDAALPQAIKVGGGLHAVPTRRARRARVDRNPPYHLLTRLSQRIGPIRT
jgi:hypothetical protein